MPGTDPVAHLVAFEDEDFVREAYRALLGREADPRGLGEYLEQLRSGVPKLELLASLAQSHEARRCLASSHALGAAAIAQLERARSPPHVSSYARLVALYDVSFVRAAYRLLLGRDADSDGLRTYVELLRAGEPKVDVLKALRRSAESRAAGDVGTSKTLLDAIDDAIGKQFWAGLPVVGGIAAALCGAESYRESARRLRRLENTLYRVEEALHMNDFDADHAIAAGKPAPATGDGPVDVRVSNGAEVASLLTTLPSA